MKPTLEQLEAISERYQGKIDSMKSQGDPSTFSNFNHRVGGSSTMILVPEFIFETWDRNRENYRKSLRGLRAYFTLLEENEEFKEAELSAREGFLNKPYISLADYVNKSRRKLQEAEDES